ncbi:biliverdin-producing heme oxygenase [Actinomadura macra]|uniref:biliverdin-producing heme oxygenase n=1 Tax=Actinomadura macra TaxID=46164 RepID=UPI000A03F566|nr:biliverdin-producing heme oxygenase [Actinomadura macra]
MEQEPFTAEVVAAIARHMNDDHAADSVVIVRALGGQPAATAAVMTGMDADGIDFSVQVDGRSVPVRIPWSERLTQRAQVRAEVVRMYDKAREAERFSVRLRMATRPDHGDTEHSPFMDALVEGRLNRDEYALLVGQLSFVYDVLEQAADRMHDDEVAGTFDFPAFRRLDALHSDLEFFYGPGWREHVQADEATRRYCDRLRAVCFDWPGGFVAHHYTRYLGDLSGGQVIARRLKGVYGLADGNGLRFYEFEGRPKVMKDRYRALLDDAPWDEAERGRVIAEVKTAYRLNAELITALGRRLPVDPAA